MLRSLCYVYNIKINNKREMVGIKTRQNLKIFMIPYFLKTNFYFFISSKMSLSSK